MQRSFSIDALKIAAAQVIVLHHLSAYGPLAEAFEPDWSGAVSFLFDYGRMAVHVFLVIGGFLAARSLERKASIEPLKLIALRFARLVPIYLVALVWVSLVVAASRRTIHADWLPGPPNVVQALTHALLVHDIFDQPALSSGVWYVAIDLQLYSMFVLMAFALAAGPRAFRRTSLSIFVLLACATSLLVFNRYPELDDWAIYFFGSYGLGVLAAWARRSRVDASLYLLALVAAGAAMWIEPRARMALAMGTSLLLLWSADRKTRATPWATLRARLADSSYALFLSHFALVVIVSAAWNSLRLSGYPAALTALLAAWGGSILLALGLHERVEAPVHRWIFQEAKTSPRH